MFDYLHELTEDFTLGCAYCLVSHKPNQSCDGPCQVRNDHTCAQNKLLVQLPEGHEWLEIRQRPESYEGYQDLCENSALGRCNGNCHFPHSELEQQLWNKEHQKKSVIRDFIEDMRQNNLVVYAFTQLKDIWHGNFEMFCKRCHQQPMTVWSKKKRRQTVCEKGHHWKQPLLAFVSDNGVPNKNTVVTSQLLESLGKQGLLRICPSVLATLKEIGFTANEITEGYYNDSSQKIVAGMKNLSLDHRRTVSRGSNHNHISRPPQ